MAGCRDGGWPRAATAARPCTLVHGQTARECAACGRRRWSTSTSPDFSFPSRQAQRGAGIRDPLLGRPQVWAWRPGRSRMIAAFLVICWRWLPSNRPTSSARGLACTFSRPNRSSNRARTAATAGGPGTARIEAKKPAASAAAGSRRTIPRGASCPIRRGGGPAGERDRNGARVLEPVGRRGGGQWWHALWGEWPVPVTVVRDRAEKYDPIAPADVALARLGDGGARTGDGQLPAYRPPAEPLSAWLGTPPHPGGLRQPGQRWCSPAR
jgi:hypothetical protein